MARTKRREPDVIARLDNVAQAIERHKLIWPFTVPVEVRLEMYEAIVQLFAEGLVDGTLRYEGDGKSPTLWPFANIVTAGVVAQEAE